MSTEGHRHKPTSPSGNRQSTYTAASAHEDLRKVLAENLPGREFHEESLRRLEGAVRRAATSGLLDDSLWGRIAALLFRCDPLGVANREVSLLFGSDGIVRIWGVNDDEYAAEASEIAGALPACASEADAVAAVRNAFPDIPEGHDRTWARIGRRVWVLWHVERRRQGNAP